ncbi:hypothetical protein A5784_35250 [Mycobacterium sp. 852013-50091_SCH5140682]|nr:hypothetical protein A5784_35250 [Mycobacterium sp. 852013-50091_SCH5140682]
MRDIETVDAELRVLSAYRRACAVTGQAVRSMVVADRLLDEWLALADGGTGHPGAAIASPTKQLPEIDCATNRRGPLAQTNEGPSL